MQVHGSFANPPFCDDGFIVAHKKGKAIGLMGTLADLNRILNAAGGRKRQSRKGFKFVSGKVLSVCADSRFAEPRSSLERF